MCTSRGRAGKRNRCRDADPHKGARPRDTIPRLPRRAFCRLTKPPPKKGNSAESAAGGPPKGQAAAEKGPRLPVESGRTRGRVVPAPIAQARRGFNESTALMRARRGLLPLCSRNRPLAAVFSGDCSFVGSLRANESRLRR